MSREDAPEVQQTPDVSAAVHVHDVVHQRTRLGLLVTPGLPADVPSIGPQLD